eukprot:GHVR01191665.1.p2 GENE.GHVR01191665.1~~GHVR01191665.1.p2  ORF type:complete len:108 (+),score=71.05 GHVR01191665.1:1744-2067(+)
MLFYCVCVCVFVQAAGHEGSTCTHTHTHMPIDQRSGLCAVIHTHTHTHTHAFTDIATLESFGISDQEDYYINVRITGVQLNPNKLEASIIWPSKKRCLSHTHTHTHY